MANNHDLVARLGQVRHFEELGRDDLEKIVQSGQVRRVSKDTVIFREGEACAGLFVLLNGRVHLVKLGPDGQEVILAVVEPVIMFNEVAALDGESNAATALAVDDSILWRVPAANLRDLLTRYPSMALGLLEVLARRNRFLVGQYEDLSFRSVLSRSAKLLLDLSQGGRKTVNRYKYPNKDMAARIATVPEAFSRSLRIFRKEGVIQTSRAELVVLDPIWLTHAARIGPVLPEV
ncbi:MAG: Crp/Fnr family transcriptional regulator [Anaerolineales bacterium]|jgi:CRP/FNR family transcriptional regulator